MDELILARVDATLDTLAREQGVRVLYACESGSRAWGFASTDSDYDVRFIYVRPRAAYLRLDPPRDVIELPITGDLDINGWDIYKALRLLRKSNPPLLEWLCSPIVYREASPVIATLRQEASANYSGPALVHHYRNMAQGNYHSYIAGKAEVTRKKYLYALRPIVAVLYLERRQAIPPTNFRQTLAGVALQPAVLERIEQLLRDKAASTELGAGPPEPVLNAFIEEQLAQLVSSPAMAHRGAWDSARLDALLASALDEVAVPVQ